VLPDFAQVEEALRAWMAQAGIRADQLVLNRRGHPVLMLPLTSPPQPTEGNGRHNIPLEILKVVREAGKRMTGVLIFEALTERGIRTNDRTVNGHLADMVKDGTLTNDQKAKPPGYGLPE
jgi:hypothetical protein